MSVQAITWALKQEVAQSSAKCVLIVLANYADENGFCYPSHERLSRDTSQERKTLILNLKRLIEIGLLRDTGQRCGTTGRVVVYQLIVPKTASFNSAENGQVIVPKTAPVIVPKTAHRTVSGTVKERTPYSPPAGDDDEKHRKRMVNFSIAKQAEAIYNAYPLKAGCGFAMKAITKALKNGVDANWLLERTKQFAAAWNGSKEFCPYPATWFNQERYKDDPSTWGDRHDKSKTTPETKKQREFREFKERQRLRKLKKHDQGTTEAGRPDSGLVRASEVFGEAN